MVADPEAAVRGSGLGQEAPPDPLAHLEFRFGSPCRRTGEPNRHLVPAALPGHAGLNRFGDHPIDFFHWEHRMGPWGSSAQSELDAAMPILGGFNSRLLLASASGLPRERRLTKRLHVDLIAARFDPDHAAIPLASGPAEPVDAHPGATPINLFGRLRRQTGI